MIEAQKDVLVERDLPDPEVPEKAKRRIFKAAYKKRILAEVEAAAASGNIGEILRQEGICSSTLTGWRKEREAAVDAAFSQKRGPEPQPNPLAGENEKLRGRNQRLEEDLRKAELIIEVQKNYHCCWAGHCHRCRTARTPYGGRRRTQLAGRRAARSSSRRLKNEEKSTVLAYLHEERFQDCSPAKVYASLLENGQYHCSIRTMYRLLDAEEENRERRDQLIHPPYRKPELLANRTNPTLELGYHQAQGASQMELLLSVRHPRRV